MSQTDLNVANASGASVRTDINAHLDALASLSSGASAPSPAFPNQFWYDTSSNQLKKRNNANTLWLSTPQIEAVLNTNSHQLQLSKGNDIASASPLVLGTDGNAFTVTGTTGFSQIDCVAGTWFILEFAAALTMTDGANLDLGGIDIITATGDRGLFRATATDKAQLVVPFFREGRTAFRATNLLVSNVTGDSTGYIVVLATVVYDHGSDFDGVSTFTAPVTGKYLLTKHIRVSGITLDRLTTMVSRITTSNDLYNTRFLTDSWEGTEFTHTDAIIADMDAGDTASIYVENTGDSGGKVHDIRAGEAHFSGALLA